jgi:HD-GYP domain-containing protein (c-di-GMP phosphodiesterase class II)
METHVVKGYDLVIRTNMPPAVATVVRYHHEHWDGQGYPDGLQGPEIPVAARLLAVADAFDAMTSDRPYRKAMAPCEARRQIVEGAGTQFDPAMVAAFERIYERWAALHHL